MFSILKPFFRNSQPGFKQEQLEAIDTQSPIFIFAIYMKAPLSRLTIFLFLFFLVSSTPALAGHDAILAKIVAAAKEHFAHFKTAEEVYKEAIAFRDGKRNFKLDSLHTIAYALFGFNQAYVSGPKNSELMFKAIHNLAMLHLALGDIAKGHFYLQMAVEAGFEPSARNFKILEKALYMNGNNPIMAQSALPANLQELHPYGYVANNFAEEIFEKLLAAGIKKVMLTDEEVKLYALTQEELAEYDTLSLEIEQSVATSENACIILLGRSPLILGLMLKARGNLSIPIISLPFSGAKFQDSDIDIDKTIAAYLSFLSQKLKVRFMKYFVIDTHQHGKTFDRFGSLMHAYGVAPENLHALAIDLSPPGERRIQLAIPQHFGSITLLSHCWKMICRVAPKRLFERVYLLPGIAFFPRHWTSAHHREAALRFDNEPNNPVVEYFARQIQEHVEQNQLNLVEDSVIPPLLARDFAVFDLPVL